MVREDSDLETAAGERLLQATLFYRGGNRPELPASGTPRALGGASVSQGLLPLV